MTCSLSFVDVDYGSYSRCDQDHHLDLSRRICRDVLSRRLAYADAGGDRNSRNGFAAELAYWHNQKKELENEPDREKLMILYKMYCTLNVINPIGWGVVGRPDGWHSMMVDAEVHKRAVRRRRQDIDQREWVNKLRRECIAWPSAARAGSAAAVDDSSGWQERDWLS
jgi:hypothetical protein